MLAHALEPVLLEAGSAASDFTAFAAANDVIAVRLIDALEAGGRRVPDDVSVVGFDGTDLGAHSRIRLTTVAQPRGRLISDGLRLLTERMGGEAGPARHVRLEPELVVRGTTA
jgi:LacI family transcriptional regulator